MTRRIRPNRELLIPAPWRTSQLRDALNEIPVAVMQESVLPAALTLRALEYFVPSETRVVILGQDPYPKPGKANGLAFGIRPGWEGDRTQSSSGNVAREASGGVPDAVADGIRPGFDFSLESWAKQGVLLLNCDLSCRPGEPGSHRGVWRDVVRAVVSQLPAGVVWLAWGAEARRFACVNRRDEDHIITTSHPCRYSATRGSRFAQPFVGSNCFSAVNNVLSLLARRPVKWTSKLVYGAVPTNRLLDYIK